MAQQLKTSNGPVDWPAIHRKMEALEAEMAAGGRLSPERSRILLEERSRALAQPAITGPVGERLEIVSFSLGNEVYGIESRYVFEVFGLQDLALLPGAEPPVVGVTAWRGDLLTILDLRPVLGLRVAALNDLSRVIVLGGVCPEFGVLADTVRELVSVAALDLRPPQQGATPAHDLVRGITGDAMLLLDGLRLLHLTRPESA